jgi:hypothetical protein
MFIRVKRSRQTKKVNSIELVLVDCLPCRQYVDLFDVYEWEEEEEEEEETTIIDIESIDMEMYVQPNICFVRHCWHITSNTIVNRMISEYKLFPLEAFIHE